MNIVNDVLDLSKIEAGMMRIEAAPFSIRGLLHSVETMFQSKAIEKNLLLTSSVDNNIPDELEGDATRLTQVLVNLVGNAIKFTSKGTVDVSIDLEAIKADAIETRITVSDTGIGIQKEKLQVIFNRFQQAEETMTRKYGGTGLGLSIVQELVLLQKGTIHVESEAGEGTRVVITIPYKVASAVIRSTAKPFLPV
ncbi:MAG: sensor histidine kinase, partial [Pedobacter sp.]